jgi:hypothetical protein
MRTRTEKTNSPDPHPPREEAVWTEPTDSHLSVGHPVHRPVRYREWTNPHGADFTDWEAACGYVSTTSGSTRFTGRPPMAFSSVLSARRKELCRTCWPDRWRKQ